MARKFFATVYTLTVLSEDEPPASDLDLEALAEAITTGPRSGQLEQTSVRELTGAEAAQALIAQGSAPEFFRLTEDGRDLDEDA